MTLLPKLVSKEMTLFSFWFVVSWTITISSNLIWNIAANRYTAVDIALIHTKKSFKKDILVRRWNISHGGLYVPLTEKSHLIFVFPPFQKEILLHHPIGS